MRLVGKVLPPVKIFIRRKGTVEGFIFLAESEKMRFPENKMVVMMDRKAKLMKLAENVQPELIEPLVDKLLFLENQLDGLEKLPMIRVDPNNSQHQKSTPAAKLYKEFLQQYTNVIKVISKTIGNENDVETSPLREWIKQRDGHE